METIKSFPNGFKNWIETFYEVVAEIERELSKDNPKETIKETQNNFGHAGLYDLAEELTNEFETLYKDKNWAESEKMFYETLEEFLSEKI